MKKPKMTPWFSEGRRPVRKGVYQRKIESGRLVYSRWNGKHWNVWTHTPEIASGCREKSSYQYLPWRGLAERP